MHKEINCWLYYIFLLYSFFFISLLTSVLSCCLACSFENDLNSKRQGREFLEFQVTINNMPLRFLSLESLRGRCRRKSGVEHNFRFIAKLPCLCFTSECCRLVSSAIATVGQLQAPPGKGRTEPSPFFSCVHHSDNSLPFSWKQCESQERPTLLCRTSSFLQKPRLTGLKTSP